ncbi:DNA polymerase III subunit gamma/tau [Erysipelotrichaceae bacterium 51-3]
MAYQALYRKYRPASFDDVVGQKHIVQTLKNAISKNRIAHAYLFCGPRGTGKTSIAKIFARTLNCTGENPPCMECENCKLSLSGTHPDIIEIDAASNNGVDEVRALIDRVGYAPLEGKYKVYIIDEVHMMTSGAFNALLKTIEEPPAHVIFIFATTEPHKVLPTILSRCQRYDFSKVSHKDIEDRLTYVCQQESVNADEEALSLIAELADGGMRDALSILDQCIAYEQNHLTIDDVREIYGVVQPEEIGDLVEDLVPERANDAMEKLTLIERKGMDMKRFTADLISLYKDSLLQELYSKTDLISEKRKKVIEKSFLSQPVDKRIQILNDLMNLYNKLAYSSNVMDYIETILLKNALWKPAPMFQPSVQPVSQPQYERRNLVQNRSEQKSDRLIQHQNPTVSTASASPKPDLANKFWNMNVSRETSEKTTKHQSEFRFSEDFLLSLLVGATKTEKNNDLTHMKDGSKYANDLEYAKFALSLRGSRIAASGNSYILLGVTNNLIKDNINGLEQSIGYEAFTNKLLGKPKKVFAITLDEVTSLFTAYKKRAAQKSLPDPAMIEVLLPASEQEIPVEEQLKKRFADLKIEEN